MYLTQSKLSVSSRKLLNSRLIDAVAYRNAPLVTLIGLIAVTQHN